MNRVIKRMIMTLVMALMCTGIFTVRAEAKTGRIKVNSPSGKTVKVAKGKKVKLKVKVKKLKNKKVTYKSSNPSIAKVSANGIVKGVKAGKTNITVVSKADKKVKKTVKVIVYKKAVKKIKLNAQSKTLTKGKQFELKAEVLPKKKVSKTLKFSSSNSKVATVTKEGLVKAVGIGTADIIVKATDGSKKKSVCVVNVVNPKKKIGIKSLKIRSGYSMDVVLTGAKKLKLEDFKAYYKYNVEDKYTVEIGIKDVYTQDNIHYEVVFKTSLTYSSYVKVEIKSLSGIKSKDIAIDTFYYGEDTTSANVSNNLIEGNVENKYIFKKTDEYVYFYAFDGRPHVKCALPVKMSVSNLPEGLKAFYLRNDTEVLISGYCKQKLNGHKIVITGVDAKGKKIYRNVYLYVGDDSTNYAKAIDATHLSYKPDEEELRSNYDYTPTVYSTDLDSRGYSMSDTWTDYEAVGLPENVEITDEGNLKIVDLHKEVKAGTYNILITANTRTGSDIIIRYKLTLVDGVYVSGKYTDANGNPVERNIYFKSNGNQDGYSFTSYVKSDEKGNYRVRLIPNIYNVCDKGLYNSYQNDFRKTTKYNLNANYYRVELTNKILNDVDDEIHYFSIYDVENDHGSYISEFTVMYAENNYDPHTAISSAKIFTYLKKGHEYKISRESSVNLDSYNVLHNGKKYIVDAKRFTYKGEKSIHITFLEKE